MALQRIIDVDMIAVKEVLKRKGIIEASYSRVPTATLDEFVQRELDRKLLTAKPYLLDY